MKILILGGTGAIGANLVEVLGDGGHDVTVTSRQNRTSRYGNVQYVTGNAADDEFLKKMLSGDPCHYDAIVDFMAYSTEAFSRRMNLLLNSTKQYFYFSSSRVYADSDIPITEEAGRLLDVCKDDSYLKTDEYALAKARQENALRSSGMNNWTIIRPYITYSNIRLQLGFQEKELWLYRALHGRTIVFSEDIGDKVTTLTWGMDLARAISKLIGKDEALGEAFHITQTTTMRWKEILELYVESIENVTGKRPKVLMEKSSENLGIVSGRNLQRKYDRLYNRIFDSSKIAAIYPELQNAKTMQDGLRDCLREFMQGDKSFRGMNWKAEGYMDKIAHEHTPLSEISGVKNKAKYLVARYTPYFEKRKK